MGGGSWSYILGMWAEWTFLLVRGIYLGEGIFLVGVDGSFFISGWGWVTVYFGWVGVNGSFLWVEVRADGEGEGLFWESGGA